MLKWCRINQLDDLIRKPLQHDITRLLFVFAITQLVFSVITIVTSFMDDRTTGVVLDVSILLVRVCACHRN